MLAMLKSKEFLIGAAIGFLVLPRVVKVVQAQMESRAKPVAS